MMIRWTGKSTDGLWRREAQAETMTELYNKLVDNGAITLDDYDPYEKAIIEKAGYKYSEFMEQWEEGSNGAYTDEYFREKTDGVDLTDEELYEVIKEERGNAFYQTFEDQDGNELRFDMNGNLRDLRSESIWYSFDDKGNTGRTDATYEEAKEDAEKMAIEYPDDDWTFNLQD